MSARRLLFRLEAVPAIVALVIEFAEPVPDVRGVFWQFGGAGLPALARRGAVLVGFCQSKLGLRKDDQLVSEAFEKFASSSKNWVT